MTKTIDYYMTMASPWCYLGHARLRAIAEKHGATINMMPVSFGAIFPTTGGLPLPKRPPARLANRLQELRRWRDFTGVALNLTPKFHPYNDSLPNHMVVAATIAGVDAYNLAEACMRATFAEERNLADPAELTAVADAAGFDGKALVAAAADSAVAARFEADTKTALSRNVFGAPSYIIDDEFFWGQDRLDFVDRYLATDA